MLILCLFVVVVQEGSSVLHTRTKNKVQIRYACVGCFVQLMRFIFVINTLITCSTIVHELAPVMCSDFVLNAF